MESQRERNRVELAKYKPKINVVITEEQREKLQKLIPWGALKPLYHVITNQLIQMIEEYGEMSIYAIITGKINFIDVMKAYDQRVKDPTDGTK